jgi:hypothetical protein
VALSSYKKVKLDVLVFLHRLGEGAKFLFIFVDKVILWPLPALSVEYFDVLRISYV